MQSHGQINEHEKALRFLWITAFIMLVIITVSSMWFAHIMETRENQETKEVTTPVSLGRELVAPLTPPTTTPTPTPRTDYLSFFMNQSPVSRAERDNNFKMDVYFPDTRTSDEVACAQALLQYAGFYIDTEEFISEYVVTGELETKNDGQLYGDHPIDAFTGDPRSDTGTNGGYVDVMMNAVSRFLREYDASYTVLNLKNQSIEQLDDLILGRNVPVCVWTTLGKYEDAQGDSWHTTEAGELFTWDTRTKCMILTGYDGDYEIVGDPTEGATEEYATHVISSNYDSLNRMAYAIVPKEGGNNTPIQRAINNKATFSYSGDVIDYHQMYGY